ncbi:MAG: SPOR domain-containing protein, partial [Candidatus Omnitrophica bacterium]|nr:SPOR domain-containing protein [Candidatus Omnitrophota bacterium]
IQLASYKARKFADKEAEVLKKKGLTAFVLYKGDYVILCAGKFSDKEEARNSMSQLKTRYKDCYLRRL